MIPHECPICKADLMPVNAPGPEGRPERVECTGGKQHSWHVINKGTPEQPKYSLGDPLD